MNYSHPKDEIIRELYISGKSIRQVAETLAISRSVVAYAIARLGITRKPPQNGTLGHELEIIALAKIGLGWKAISNKLGIKSRSVTAIRTLLTKNGINAKWDKQRDQRLWSLSETHAWGTYDIDEQLKAERTYERAIRKAYHTPKDPMIAYYANHEAKKAYGASKARERHARMKDRPEFKAKVFARNQLKRIARQCRTKRKTQRTHIYLGCSYAQAADYIANQFTSNNGFTWENYGSIWEIDHKIQLSDIDLLNDTELMRVCNYTNLRPLAVRDNRSRPKGLLAWQQMRGIIT